MPKLTILLIVLATELFIFVITKTPKKLNNALIRMALRSPIQFVATQVAMAFGASVHPFTKITPSVRATVINRAGFVTISRINDDNDRYINSPFLLKHNL